MSARKKGIIALAIIAALLVYGLMPMQYIEAYLFIGLIFGVPLGLIAAIVAAVWAIVTNRSPLRRR